jgi:hypothetical protein
MLTIRSTQFEALCQSRDAGLARVLVPLFRSSWPGPTAALDDAALGERIRTALAAARARGIVDDRDAAHFVNLTFALGPAFPAADASGRETIAALYNGARRRLR